MLNCFAVHGLPEILPGDDLARLIGDGLAADAQLGVGLAFQQGDIVIVTQKIVSKAEGRFAVLTDIVPSAAALALAAEVRKDPRLVELVLRESSAIVRKAPHVLIARHHLGHVMANAGIDASNIGVNAGAAESDELVLLLPQDPDASAARMGMALADRFGFHVPVVISDSFGRPWRMGTVNVAIGLYGLPAVVDERGDTDRNGRVMQVTQVALADAIAAAAGLVMGEGAQGIPVAIMRGVELPPQDRAGLPLLRPEQEDLFR